MSENTVRHPSWPAGYENYMTLVEAAEVLGVKYPGYVRTLILPKRNEEGEIVKPAKIVAVQLQQGKQKRWALDPDSVDNYAANRGTFGATGRAGKRRAVVRFDNSKTSIEAIREILAKELGDALIEVAKPYQWKKKDGDEPKDAKEEETWRIATVDSLVPDIEEAEEDDDTGMDL